MRPARIDEAASHAALMDSVYQYQRYIYDFTRKYYLFGRDRLIRELALQPGEHVVEIGCGTARNLICMARRYPHAQLYGLDASHEMLKSAAQKIANAGLCDRITLAHGYAEALTPALFGRTVPFDRVVFSYSLSMIPDWNQALVAAQAALAAKGRLHIVDFGDFAGLGFVGRRLLQGWLRLFHVVPRAEILRTVETAMRRNAPDQNSRLTMTTFPGRYAFVFNCTRHEISTFMN